mmetsp:Transcript_124566/g.195194  ORF Transcript_124566/g.195194 Transcript_124566/m.195194 type:complete len:206 (+) Transcript_124566:319-936(+)
MELDKYFSKGDPFGRVVFVVGRRVQVHFCVFFMAQREHLWCRSKLWSRISPCLRFWLIDVFVSDRSWKCSVFVCWRCTWSSGSDQGERRIWTWNYHCLHYWLSSETLGMRWAIPHRVCCREVCESSAVRWRRQSPHASYGASLDRARYESWKDVSPRGWARLSSQHALRHIEDQHPTDAFRHLSCDFCQHCATDARWSIVNEGWG